MHRTALKCEHCRKAYQQVKVSQKYCSHKCRQAAYRRRKQAGKPSPKTNADNVTIRLSPAICDHCNGTFWAKSKRAQFCSTSCRVMHHRAMKNAIPDALALVYGLPVDKAADLLETMPIARVKATLTDCGWLWNAHSRAWVQRLEMKVGV